MPNIWLPEDVLPGYRDFATNLYWQLEKTSKHILQAFAVGLNLSDEERDKWLKQHSGHNNQLRLLHYPAVATQKLESQVVSRMPAHQDWSCFTLDFQDDVGGLELQDPRKPGHFIHAQPLKNACVLNIGDMLQRLTNGKYADPKAALQVRCWEMEY